METTNPSNLLGEHIDYYSKNRIFGTCIVISIFFDCSHSGPAQDSIIPSIGNFWRKFCR